MDPLTTVVITAAIQGAIDGLKPTTENAIKDAYAAFKKIIVDRYKNHQDLINAVEALTDEPKDTNLQESVKDQLIKAGATKDPILIGAANAIHLAGEVNQTKKNILGQRIQRKLKQVEALEDQVDLTIDVSQKVIFEEKAEILWKEIAVLEEELTKME